MTRNIYECSGIKRFKISLTFSKKEIKVKYTALLQWNGFIAVIRTLNYFLYWENFFNEVGKKTDRISLDDEISKGNIAKQKTIPKFKNDFLI